MKKIFLQIGATRDGQNPYCEVAQREGYFTVLAEMGDFIDYQSIGLNLPFDMVLRINRPESPYEVMQAWMNAGLLEHPQVVLAGFEAYNQSAGRVREMLADPLDRQCFIPLDKYAQRMALKKALPSFPQPEFRFFASALSIKDARNALIYPCVIKPVDGGGGLGVWLVKTPQELDKAVMSLVSTMNYGGRCFSGFIVECCLEGQEYSLQGVVCEGRPYALTCCQKLIERIGEGDGPIGFYESGHVGVAAHDLPPAFTRLMHFCCKIFDYRQGAFHIDFIVVNGVPHFLEMGFRLSGMGVVNLVKEVTGLNWAEIAFNLEQGKNFGGLPFDTPHHAVGQLRLRQRPQLAAAELWIHQNQRGTIAPPIALPQLIVSHDSALYADLTRHAGILGTLRLEAADPREIMALFNSVTSIHHLPARRDLQCAE
ncbi:ATP-grasp domain-containing protein [Paramixta manurensis]|uniref:ATP-grasp domain-containing protein n=1 Tax=Paramixta manurensis TaxID=2740817 RepID=A0A6M8U352_9GAMM|nr:ATP-grasp domain-containing protein [Erwiniaceae bacterium PD-1]